MSSYPLLSMGFKVQVKESLPKGELYPSLLTMHMQLNHSLESTHGFHI